MLCTLKQRNIIGKTGKYKTPETHRITSKKRNNIARKIRCGCINKFMTYNTTNHHYKRLSQALLPWLSTHAYTHFVTLTYNQTDFYKPRQTLAIARDKLKHFHAKLDDKLLGSSWYKKPREERTFFIAFPEKIATNMHYHLLMRLHKRHEETFKAAASNIWKSIVRSGTFDCQAFDTAPNPEGFLSYASKEQGKALNFNNSIISTEFLNM